MKLTTLRSRSSVRRTISTAAHDFSRGALAGAFLLLACAAITHADTPAPVSSTPTRAASVDEVNAFALGYALEYSHLQAFAFVDEVKSLRNVDDDTKAGAMVQDLAAKGEVLRSLESDTYRRGAELTQTLQGPRNASRWLEKTAAALRKPADKAPRGIVSDELAVEHVSAILDETGRVQKEMLENVVLLEPALEARSPEARWAFDAGTYDAKIHLWNGFSADLPMLNKEATHLTKTAPVSTPVAITAGLRLVAGDGTLPSLEKGKGNLASLLPGGDENIAKNLHGLFNTLNDQYNAYDLVAALDAEVATHK